MTDAELMDLTAGDRNKPRTCQIHCGKCDIYMWIPRNVSKACRFCGFTRTGVVDTIRTSDVRNASMGVV